MNNSKKVYYYEERKIKDLLIGRKVVEVDDDTLVLDNGQRLRVVGNIGCCCGAGDYYVRHLSTCNNAITNVEFSCEYEEKRYETYQAYRIFVIADGIQTMLLDVYGTDGNGYYGSGYWLEVYMEDTDAD